MLKISFHPKAWEEYVDFLDDKKTLRKINSLIKAIAREGGTLEGVGKPEALLGDLQGCFSRRIDSKNRIIYRINDNQCEILQVGSHYGDK